MEDQENQPSLLFLSASEKRILDSFTENAVKQPTIKAAVTATCVQLNLSRKRVEAAISKSSAQNKVDGLIETIKEDVYSERIPKIKEIVGTSLNIVSEYLENLYYDEERKMMLTPKDIKDISDIASKLNDLIRLEEGKTTANIGIGIAVNHQHSHKMTYDKLARLKTLDPVFEYPELPESPNVEPSGS